MDITEAIADALRREVDARKVAREINRQIEGRPYYTWEDEHGVVRQGEEPPPGAAMVRAHVPDNAERMKAVQTYAKMTLPKRVDHKHEFGPVTRTKLDEYLDALPAEDLQRMIGPPRADDSIEVELVEDTLPREP